MFRKITTWLVVIILGLAPFLGATGQVVAQSESGFSDGIVVDELASGEIPTSVMAPGTLTLERVVMPPDAGLPARRVSDSEILYVEQGTLTIADGLGLSSPLEAESSVHLRPGSSYTAINDGDSDVTFLRLALETSNATATPSALPLSQPEASDNIEVTTLAAFALPIVPASPTTLFLSRATWGAGVDSGEYTQNGPIGIYTESGLLTISSPSGIEGQLGEGQTVLLPADQVLRTRNDGTSDAVALLFGIIPSNGPAVTAMAERVTMTSGSDSHNATSTAAGTVLYQADATTGFEEWSSAGGWITVGGMLVNDGSSDKPIFSAGPYQPPVVDYAVEAEMQWVRDGLTFGVVVRGGDDAGYWTGYGSTDCDGNWNLATWAGPPPSDPNYACDLRADNLILLSDVSLDADWHTYRIEVQGNAIRVFLDGTKLLETSDNRFLSSGQVGLWSAGAQVNVRSITVTALGES